MADFIAEKPKIQRAYLVGVHTSKMPEGEGEELLKELRELVENLGIEIVRTTLVTLRLVSPAFLLGSGKAAELIAQAKEDGADVIVVDESLSPAQQRNWEAESGLAVIDRQEVILEIFAQRAHTKEAVLQVALARMQYSLPRLKRAWTHLSRQRGGGTGGRGQGETQLETDRRLVNERIATLKRSLVDVVQQREVQRRRRMRVPIPTAAIVGYTNAGKSSLLNRLTGAEVLAVDKLFATLDPTTRQLVLGDNQKLLVTDTVGFIRRLPHGLVEAFKATLEEVIVANFLIHVLDLSNPNVDKHHATTLEVMRELKADQKPIITVFNKTDAVADPARLATAKAQFPDAIFLSVKTGKNMEELLNRCSDIIAAEFESTEFLFPHDRYDLIAKLHASGSVRSQETRDDGIYVRGRNAPGQAGLFAPFLLPGNKRGKAKKLAVG